MSDLLSRPPAPPDAADARDRPPWPYPYVIWRTPGAYFTCVLEMFEGPEGGSFHPNGAWVQHPLIVPGSRAVSEALRAEIERIASGFVQPAPKFDFCLIWAARDVTFVYKDHKTLRSDTPPGSAIMF